MYYKVEHAHDIIRENMEMKDHLENGQATKKGAFRFVMKASELRSWIDSLTQDIDFSYHGIAGSICPFSRSNIALCYGDTYIDVDSVDAAMNAPLIDGKSLEVLCEQLDI
jgi:hypothetical protein